MTTIRDWHITSGERSTRSFPVYNAGNALATITDWTVLVVFKTRRGGEVLYTLPAEHITIIDTTVGAVTTPDSTVRMVVPGPVSAAWTFTSGYYSVRITDPDTDPTDPDSSRVLAGGVWVDAD